MFEKGQISLSSGWSPIQSSALGRTHVLIGQLEKLVEERKSPYKDRFYFNLEGTHIY